MGNIYYHVVTNKPMKLNQIIVFDEDHTSGVYDRVYALKTVVDDIYNNPSKYKNEEIDHHTKVALRELALEKVRKEKYPNYPSRLASLYVSKTYEEAKKWFDFFIYVGRPTYQIVKVEVDGSSYTGDACNCFDGTTSEKTNLELAENYWKEKVNKENKEPIFETIVNGKIKVIEIVYTKD